MWLGVLIAASLLGAAPAATTADEPAVAALPVAALPEITAIVLDAAAVDAELTGELELRASGRELLASDAITELPHARFVWLSVRWIADDRAELELIGADGRAYAREVTAPREQLRRALAGAAANMIAAIERGEIVPDRSGVAVPQPQARAAAPAPPRAPAPATSQAPAPALRTGPLPPPRWELGPHASGMFAIGLGPPLELDGVVGGGAAIGVDARHRVGALVGGSVRVSTIARAGLRLVRIRVAVTGGYSLRRGRFELLSRLGVAVEPIVLLDDGTREQPRRPGGGSTSAAPLIGLLAMVSPGVLLQPWRSATRLRLSLDVELSAAMEARAQPGVARYLDDRVDPPRPRLRAGGVELALGIGLGGWIPLPRAVTAR